MQITLKEAQALAQRSWSDYRAGNALTPWLGWWSKAFDGADDRLDGLQLFDNLTALGFDTDTADDLAMGW